MAIRIEGLPSDWEIVSTGGSNIIARNSKLGASFTGTLTEFNNRLANGWDRIEFTTEATMGNLINGEWFPITSVFRLLMTGSGTVTIDSKDALETVTIGVYSVTLINATNQIGFPYAGDAAVQIRATLTGTATAKVI